MTTETFFPTNEAILVPVVGQSKRFPINRIFCVGRNYMAHAAEMGVSVDKTTQEPFYFLKDASCYVPSGSSIDYPPQTQNYHHEMELVVAIGKAGFRIELYWSSRAGHFYLRIFILQWTHSIVGCMRPFKIVIMNELRDFLFNNVFIHGRSVT